MDNLLASENYSPNKDLTEQIVGCSSSYTLVLNLISMAISPKRKNAWLMIESVIYVEVILLVMNSITFLNALIFPMIEENIFNNTTLGTPTRIN